jgi:UDP-N-acetylglucosamine:LPS N-acetylglucosamine transferase
MEMKTNNDVGDEARVLIIIGDAGGGHLSAANAITESFRKLYDARFRLKVIDIFTEAGVPPFKDSAQLYVKISASRFLEFFYNIFVPLLNTRAGFYLYKTYVTAKMYRATQRIIDAYRPAVVIANNSIITPLAGAMKRRGGRFIVAVLVTDIVRVFRAWADRHVDCVFTPTSEATRRLARFGVPREKIHGPLFPINPQLSVFRPRDQVLAGLGFRTEGMKTILVTAGGVGLLSMKRALDELVRDPRLQVVILAGRVPGFERELRERYAPNPRVRVFGFVDNIQDFYNASDVIVTKPGPATILEIELFQKKAVLTKRVGIQESGNAEFALRNNPNIRSIGGRWWRLKKTVDRLLEEPLVPFRDRRSFDECETIVRRIVGMWERTRRRPAGPEGGAEAEPGDVSDDGRGVKTGRT